MQTDRSRAPAEEFSRVQDYKKIHGGWQGQFLNFISTWLHAASIMFFHTHVESVQESDLFKNIKIPMKKLHHHHWPILKKDRSGVRI